MTEVYGDIRRVPESLLLWFHHVSWDHRMASGRTLWEELVARYDSGVEAVQRMQATWRSLEGRVDAERYDEVRAFLAIQEEEARWWRDASVLYFQTFSGKPIPVGYHRPEQRPRHLPGDPETARPGELSPWPLSISPDASRS